MILILDYGMGNLRSVQKAFELADPDVRISADPREIPKADRLVLPGVGAFGDAVKNIGRLGFKDPVLEHIARDRPFLGICLGMQLLFTEGFEKGRHAGFDLIPGQVLRFPESVKVPQIGWNQVAVQGACALFRGIPDNAHFYFVHSYYIKPADSRYMAGVTDYGIAYDSAVAKGALFGVQFHPEKSQRVGLDMIRNFCKI